MLFNEIKAFTLLGEVDRLQSFVEPLIRVELLLYFERSVGELKFILFCEF